VNRLKAVQAKPQEKLARRSDEQISSDLETLAALQHQTNMDVWNQPIDTLDVIIPSWTSKRPNATFSDHVKAATHTVYNRVQNIISMFRMAKDNAIPGTKVKSRWSLEIFKTQSTPWLACLRQEVLEVYTSTNAAVAENDTKAIRRYTVATYRETALKRVQNQDKANIYMWRLHGENVPCKVLSIRAFPGNLGREDPPFGNRLVIQALVKLDTLQSLQVYSQKGKLLAGDGKPKRVLEYLVFQKRGWIDGPWTIRDQLYEGLDTKFGITY